jgi:ABC-type polar amino acid transport system ATPase subunit
MGFARAVADVVAFVAAGRISEFAKPDDLFNAPKDPDVRRFLGRVLEFR